MATTPMHTEDRVAVYLNQRHSRALTPRQRRRVLHKARGTERAAALALLVALAAAGCSGGVGPRRQAIAYGAHHGFRELDPTTTDPPRPTVTAVSRSLLSPRRSLSSPRLARGGCSLDTIKQRESGGNYAAVNPNGHYGAFQFDLQTWRSVGGRGNPAAASPAEQDARAAALYAQRGSQPWSTC